MSVRYEWDDTDTTVGLATQAQLQEIADAPDEVDSGGLIFGGGSGGGFIVQGEEDDLFAFVQRVMDLLHQQQRDSLATEAGRPTGTKVRVGNGTKTWVISGYTRMGPRIVAHLSPTEGYTGTSVDVDRLVDVT